MSKNMMICVLLLLCSAVFWAQETLSPATPAEKALLNQELQDAHKKYISQNDPYFTPLYHRFFVYCDIPYMPVSVYMDLKKFSLYTKIDNEWIHEAGTFTKTKSQYLISLEIVTKNLKNLYTIHCAIPAGTCVVEGPKPEEEIFFNCAQILKKIVDEISSNVEILNDITPEQKEDYTTWMFLLAKNQIRDSIFTRYPPERDIIAYLISVEVDPDSVGSIKATFPNLQGTPVVVSFYQDTKFWATAGKMVNLCATPGPGYTLKCWLANGNVYKQKCIDIQSLDGQTAKVLFSATTKEEETASFSEEEREHKIKSVWAVTSHNPSITEKVPDQYEIVQCEHEIITQTDNIVSMNIQNQISKNTVTITPQVVLTKPGQYYYVKGIVWMYYRNTKK